MEAEARDILDIALRKPADREPMRAKNLAEIAREIFGPKHGVNLEPHPAVFIREPPDFSE